MIEQKEVRLWVISNDGDTAVCREFSNDPATVGVSHLINDMTATFTRPDGVRRGEFEYLLMEGTSFTCTRISADKNLFEDQPIQMAVAEVEKILGESLKRDAA